jgi:hypothetical protein
MSQPPPSGDDATRGYQEGGVRAAGHLDLACFAGLRTATLRGFPSPSQPQGSPDSHHASQPQVGLGAEAT